MIFHILWYCNNQLDTFFSFSSYENKRNRYIQTNHCQKCIQLGGTGIDIVKTSDSRLNSLLLASLNSTVGTVEVTIWSDGEQYEAPLFLPLLHWFRFRVAVGVGNGERRGSERAKARERAKEIWVTTKLWKKECGVAWFPLPLFLKVGCQSRIAMKQEAAIT